MKNGKAIILCTIGLLLACILGIFTGRNLPDDRIYLEQESSTNSKETTQQTDAEIQIVNINTATKEQLMDLPGIGDVLAQRILDYRQEHGDFSAPSDLLNVSGIGEKTLFEIMSYITVGG